MSAERQCNRILIIEDDSAMRSLLGDYLSLEGYSTVIFEGAPPVLSHIESQSCEIDLVISDVNMPQMDGFEFVERFHRLYPQTPVILISAFGNARYPQAAQAAGAAAYLNKPFKLADLKQTIYSVLKMGA